MLKVKFPRWSQFNDAYLEKQSNSWLGGHWILLERVYQLDQEKIENPIDGYSFLVPDRNTRRIVEARKLVNDQPEIERYKSLHAMGKAWPEITQSLKSAGIVQNEIYLVDNKSFEFYETTLDFDWSTSWENAESLPKSSECGDLVGPIDVPYVDQEGNFLENQIKRLLMVWK